MNDAVTQRTRTAAESLLDNEALTADLEDAAATELLNWGITQAEMIADLTTEMDNEAADALISAQLQEVRDFLHQISRWVTNDQTMTPEANAAFLDELIAQAAKIYPAYQPPNLEQKQAFLAQPFPDEPAQGILNLRTFIENSQAPVNA